MRAYFNRFITSLVAVILPSLLYAADDVNAAAPAAGKSDAYNPVLIGLLSLMIILLFAIGVMANVLRQLTFVYRDKMRAEKNKGTIAKTILLLFALAIPSLHAMAADADTTAVAPKVSKLISGIPKDNFYALMSVIVLEIIILIALTFVMRVLLKGLRAEPEVAVAAKARRVPFWDRFNKSVAVEHEKDVMLDHDYDGIKELDNSLPPWWKYGFYFTILFAIIYLYRFDVAHSAPSSHDEYVAEMKEAEEEKAAYLAKSANNVDENSVTQLTDAADLSAGQNIFQTTCAPCHAKDGGGIVGPNLTDDYWLHGGGIKDVFKSIKYGWQDKGMKSWKDDFSPKQIQQLASYVKSLHGTHPAAPKEKQGELYIESGGAPKTDSAKAKPLASN